MTTLSRKQSFDFIITEHANLEFACVHDRGECLITIAASARADRCGK
jgi:hypothetical protein